MENRGRGRSFVRKERPKGQPADSQPEQPKKNEPAAGVPAGPALRREERARVVVPRHERDRTDSGLDVELREVRWGAASRGAYLRVVPRKQRFTRVAPGHIEATRAGSKPPGRIEALLQAAKRIILGSPSSTAQMVHERLSKVKALAIFSSDALSSSAYATEEILLILILAGSGALDTALPISVVIVCLLAIVTISYRQTVTYYPSGGGAYSVAHENLGNGAGLLAAAALTIGYILTVSVSVAAGVAAVSSAIPAVHDVRVPLGVGMIGLLTIANLRGLREAGSVFAIPTYYFIAVMFTLIVVGTIKVALGDAPGTLTEAATPVEDVSAQESLGIFLILRAFAAGCAGLTGVEAISNGVPAFKKPESENAKATLAWMAAILGVFLIGLTFLATRYGIVPEHGETALSVIGKQVFGENILYYGLQVGTALVLFLAANTSYAGFPLMGAILAQDKYLPRQFAFRGDRLAYSNGIIALALAAAILLIAFEGSVTKLIPLYALGVFISFTLSQSGMVKHLIQLKDASWQRAVLTSAVGAIVTFAVAIIVGITRFTEGAWISMVMMAFLMVFFTLVKRHYTWYERAVAVNETQLGARAVTASPITTAREHVVVPVDTINLITMGAIDMGRAITGNITAVHLTDNAEEAEAFRDRWHEAVPDVPLLIIESPYRAFAAPMVAYFEHLEQTEPDKKITVILPGFKAHHWWENLLHNQAIRRLKPFLEDDAGITVVEYDYEVDREHHKHDTRPPAA